MSSRANYYAKTLTVCPSGDTVSRSEKMVLMVLADSHQDGAHLRTYPKVRTIAEDAMVSERQCQRIFASLERKGVLRREYPTGTGRDRVTFYFFPELDADSSAPAVKQPAGRPVSAVKKPAPKADARAAAKTNKGDKMSPLFPEEGCQKGDRRVTFSTPYLNNKNNKNNKNKDTPLPPTTTPTGEEPPLGTPDGGGSEVHPLLRNDAVDEVMRGSGFTRRRLRRVIHGALELAEQDLKPGESLQTIAAEMIAAWNEQADMGPLLRVKVGPEKFFGDNFWRRKDGWYWDYGAIGRQREARVGMQ